MCRQLTSRFWALDDIEQIGQSGFSALGVAVPQAGISALAKEAFGSPQLMQAICLEACREMGIEKANQAIMQELNTRLRRRIFERTSTVADFSSLVRSFHAGPKLRGQKRSLFKFNDHSVGDAYRAILLALRADPPALALTHQDVVRRLKHVCLNSAPAASSVRRALNQILAIADSAQPTSRVLDWTDDVPNFEDPYLLFYLRWSSQLFRLGQPTIAIEPPTEQWTGAVRLISTLARERNRRRKF